MIDKTFYKKLTKISGWLSSDEALLLYYLARQANYPGRIVEIGSYCGKSTVILAKAAMENGALPIVAVDPHMGDLDKNLPRNKETYAKYLANLKLMGVARYVETLRNTSYAASKNFNQAISLLYIDALHDYESVKLDIQSWLPKVNNTGVIAFHDAFGSTYPGVLKAIIEKLLNTHRFNKIGIAGSIVYVVLGERKSLWQRIDTYRLKRSLQLSIIIWNSKLLPEVIKEITVNIGLKPFYLNNLTFRAAIQRYFGIKTLPF